MTTVSLQEAAEFTWTCDENGKWTREQRIRIREGNGWREIRTDNLFAVVAGTERRAS